MRKSSARKNSIGLAVGGKTWLLRHTENQTSKACTADNEMRHLKRTWLDPRPKVKNKDRVAHASEHPNMKVCDGVEAKLHALLDDSYAIA